MPTISPDAKMYDFLSRYPVSLSDFYFPYTPLIFPSLYILYPVYFLPKYPVIIGPHKRAL